MKASIWVVLFLLISSSCVSTKEAMSSWVGHGRQELVQAWGPPDVVDVDGSTGQIYIYYLDSYVPNYSLTRTDVRMFYLDYSGKVYHWRIARNYTAPQQVNVNVYSN